LSQIASPWVLGLAGAALICAVISTTKASSTKKVVDRKEDHPSSILVGNRSKSLKEELTAERKAASAVTQRANASVYTQLPFEDRKDFELVTRGLVGKEESLIIKDEKGTVVWDMDAFISMLLHSKDNNTEEQQAPDTANPSLWRQCQLLAHHGLY
jgi:alkyl sulfatase BDS1-like metallo-beta-lactamase superfamily hydrolase